MNASRNILWIASHVVIFGLAYAIAERMRPVAEVPAEAPGSRSSPSSRSIRASGSDGARLLAAFREDLVRKESRYEELKKSLQPAADLQAAALAAVQQWDKATSDQERQEALALVQARFYHWLQARPHEAMQVLTRGEMGLPGAVSGYLFHWLRANVFPDVAREQGIVKSLDWLKLDPASGSAIVKVLIEEMKQGGGIALFLQVEQALAGAAQSDRNGFMGNELLRHVGGAIPFAEKDRLLAYVTQQSDPGRAREILLGFSGSGEAAASWVMGLVESGALPVEIAARMRGGIGNVVLTQPFMDMEQRIAARRFTDGNATKPREVLLAALVSNDVNRLLNEGRDWRYEFRHGAATLDEILGSMDGALNITEEGRDAAHIALYRSLSEEDPAKALPLLDRLPEEKRREVMFSNTWQSYGNINPDDFMAYLNELPAPVTAKEKQDRMKGWDWKARGLLHRHGDDYVEWVAGLPSNPDKYAAINSIIWATREQNPEKAAELNQRFYPKKP